LALPTTTTSNDTLEPDPDPSAGASADSNGCDQAETGGVALIFGFAAPEAVLVVAAGEFDTIDPNWTTVAHFLGGRFASLTSLRTFSSGREEKVSQSSAGSVTHPVVIGCDAVEFDG